MVCSNKKEVIIIVAVILIQTLSDDTWPEDDCLTSRGWSSHLINEIQVMLARNVCNIDRSTTDTSRCSMETRVFVNSLKHIPIRNQVQMLCEQRIVCIDEDVPRMTSGNLGEEIV